jgi:hypothetical protein
MKACRVITGASFDPDTVKMLGEVLDEIWQSLAPEYGSDPQAIEAARTRLAIVILALAKDHQLSAREIKRTAARLMRETTINQV